MSVVSQAGRGTTFTVAIPLGATHLPASQVETEAAAPGDGKSLGSAEAYVEETLRWLPDAPTEPHVDADTFVTPAPLAGVLAAPAAQYAPLIVIADDNADMRAYLKRLLSNEYRVAEAANGFEALAAVRREKPSLVLSDVMMPELDGFGLLMRLRADPTTCTLPCILLSARAGEEARIEGLNAGADDYLVKLFSARELLARIFAHLQLAKLRAEAEQERERLLARERLAVQHHDAFLGIASHELRTPVTSLRMQLELTQRVLARAGGDMHAVPEQRFSRMMQTFTHQLDNLTNLIDDLLDVSRIANGRLSVEPIAMDLVQVARQVLDLYQDQLERSACEVSFTHDDTVLGPWGPKRLEQVVVNLLSNAAKYAASSQVAIRLFTADAHAYLVVSDGGMGIAAEHLLKIFQRFERAVGRSNISGWGLGLYIVREIVRAHGGEITVASVLGQGSTCKIKLPRAPQGPVEIKLPQVAADGAVMG